jgi:hypothetical protein
LSYMKGKVEGDSILYIYIIKYINIGIERYMTSICYDYD